MTGAASKILGNQNRAIVTSSSATSRESDDGRCDHPASGEPYDPASVVLECKLCGACVGLWAFITVARPLEIFNLIESPEDGQRDLATCGPDGSTQHQKSSSLKLTIAGGPPPTKQYFKPRISLPIVTRHFRAAFETNSEIRSHVSEPQGTDQLHTQSPSENQEGFRSIDLPSAESPGILKQRGAENEGFASGDGMHAVHPHLNADVNVGDPSSRLIHEGGHEQSSANTDECLDYTAEAVVTSHMAAEDAENGSSTSADLVDGFFLQMEEGTCAVPDNVVSIGDDGRVNSSVMAEATIFSQDRNDSQSMNEQDGAHLAGAIGTDALQLPANRSVDSQDAAPRIADQISVGDDVVAECTSCEPPYYLLFLTSRSLFAIIRNLDGLDSL